MKFKKFLVLIVALAFIFPNLNYTALASTKKYVTQRFYAYSTPLISSQAQFYSAITNAVKSRKTALTLRVKNYNTQIYNTGTAISRAMAANPGMNYIVSGYHYRHTGSTKLATLYISFSYDYASYVAKTYNDFYNQLNYAVLHKNSSVKIKVNSYISTKYDLASNLNRVLSSNPKLTYIVSEYSGGITSNSGPKIMTIYLKYLSSNIAISSLDEFSSAVENAINAGKTALSIKINNYSNDYSLAFLNDKITASGIKDSYTLSGSFAGIKSFSAKILQLKITKQDTSTTTGSSTSGTAEVFSAASQQDLSTAIKNGIVNVDSNYTINVNYSGLSSINQVGDAIDQVLDDNPDLDYVDSYQVQTESRYGSQTVIDKVYISIKYRFTKDEILSMEKAVNDKAQEIISQIITPDMTDYQKELALHDYIVSHTKYDYQNYLNNTIPNVSYTAYGVMIKGVGVCEGYAVSMWKLLNMVGIPTLVIDGSIDGVSHAWNLVKLGGNYYHLDPTFDDPIVNGGAIDVVDHTYFNLSDSQLTAVDKSNGQVRTWDKNKYPACTSTEFNYK